MRGDKTVILQNKGNANTVGVEIETERGIGEQSRRFGQSISFKAWHIYMAIHLLRFDEIVP